MKTMALLAAADNLSVAQFDIVSNMFSFVVATMGAAAIFFFLSRSQVAPKYRPALMVSGLVVAIACYHYFRIYESWHAAYELAEGAYVATGAAFNDFYRYADWILTVPLLMVELIAVMTQSKSESRSLLWRLVIAAALMIGLGYPGESSDPATQTNARWLWFGLSMLPFLYIMYVLFVELTQSIQRQPQGAQGLLSLTRYVVLITWIFYPIAYLLPMFTESGPAGEVAIQLGYSIADVTAKALFGVIIYFIAAAKSEAEGWKPGSEAGATPAAATA